MINGNALLRWSLTRHLMGQYATIVTERSGVSTGDNNSTDITEGTIERDEEHSQAMYNHLVNNMTNPFQLEVLPAALINISTGVHASKGVEQSLLGVITRGTQMMENFVKGSLSTEGTSSFYKAIPRSGLQTFSDMAKQTKIRVGKEMKSVRASPMLIFRRALSLAESREEVNLDTILSYPVGPLPSSLFHEDGTMRKGTKSHLAHKLEEAPKQPKVYTLPDFDKSKSVYITDAMACIQVLKPGPRQTFDDVGSLYKTQLVKGFDIADSLIDVFDRYDCPDSTKAAERSRREGTTLGSKIYEVKGGRVIPPWDKFGSSHDFPTVNLW